jgi:hypothetical protein
MKLIYFLPKIMVFCGLLSVNFNAFAQIKTENKRTITDEEMDNLVDSLIINKPTSEVNIGLGYQNKTLFAGRDLGIKQWNSVFNATYYHWSGLYADFSGFIYSKSDPKLQMTALSVGYMGDLTENLSLMAEVGRMIETKPDPNYPNQLSYWTSLSLSYSFGKLSPTADYTLMFGSETANRFRLGISYYQSYKNVGFIDRISLTPRITSIYGNQDITYSQYWTGGNLYTADSTSANITTTKRNPFNQLITKLGKKQQTLAGTKSYFGLMAVDLACGISLTKNSFRISITPHLVKPVRLYVGEDINVSWQFYYGLSCGYTFR